MPSKKKLDILLWLIKVKALFSKNTKSIQKKAIVFMVFLLIAFVGWLLRSLQDLYIADIRYPVKYINLPTGKMLVDPPPKQLTLRIRSDGYTILKNKLKFKLPIKFDVSAFSSVTANVDSSSFYILTHFAREKMEDDLGRQNSGIEIISISPDSIWFHITKIKSKTVPVKGNLKDYSSFIDKQHKQNGSLIFKPDSIKITGAQYLIDTIESLLVKKPEFVLMNDTTTYSLDLDIVKEISAQPSKVNLIVPVDRATEKEFTIKVETRNVPDSVLLKTFPSEVKVSFIVTLSNFDNASAAIFNPYVDYNDISTDETSALKIYLDSLPGFIFSPKTHPRYVEILREKRYP